MISIIVSAFDNVLYIEECLLSIIDSCEGLEYEIILGVDNCKKTLEHISKIKNKFNDNLKIYFFKKNVGTYIVRNSLSTIAKFDNLLFFDSDDVMRKILVKDVISALEHNDLVQYGYFSFTGELIHKNSNNFSNKGLLPHIGSFGIKKSVFLGTNGFEPWICAADGEFLTRMRETHKKIKFLQIVGLFYRKHSNNLTLSQTTGMNSPLRKFYHRLRDEKFKTKNFKPLDILETYEFIEYNNNLDDVLKYYQVKVQKYDEVRTPKDLSVLIATYDNVEFLDDCLNSILNSVKDLNCEIVIGIDSCSKTINFIRNKIFDPRIKFRFFDKKVGPYVIKNSLVLLSNSDKIIFFDSDDIMLENFVPDVMYNLSKSVIYKPMYENFENKLEIDNLQSKRTNKFGEGVFGIKKELFLSVNGFEPWLCAADSDFMSRIYSKKVSLTASRDIVFLRRIHPKSLTVDKETNYSSKLRAHYYMLSKRHRPNGICSSFTTYKSELLQITIEKPQSMIKFEEHKSSIDTLVHNLNINPSKQEINYEKINQVVERKGVYNPQSSKKPPRENVPNKRQELINLRKDSLRKQVRDISPGKPNRRNNLPNIF